jgi:hypothetical protein
MLCHRQLSMYMQARLLQLSMCMQARVLLLSQLGTYFWCPQPAASGDEEAEGQLQFSTGVGISGLALQEGRLLRSDNPSAHPHFDMSIDGVLGVHSLVHSLVQSSEVIVFNHQLKEAYLLEQELCGIV